jgi:UDP-glucose 4-epimerase
VRRLVAGGHRVVACDDFSIGTWRDAPDGVVWEELDVGAADAAARLDRHRPDVVLHAAAHPGGRSLAEPSADVRVNAFGAMQVFEWCAKRGIPVVYLSSSAVYGEQPPAPIRESAPLHPGTVYAVCKVACEEFLPTLGAEYGLPWTVLRLFATYGAGHRPGTSQGIVNVMLTQLMAGNRLVVRGSLDRIRDLVYVDDTAGAIAACLFDDEVRGRVFNVGTGRAIRVRELVTMLCDRLGRRESELEVVEEPPTPGDPLYNVADIDALRAVTGFSASVPIEEGLARLVGARAAR